MFAEEHKSVDPTKPPYRGYRPSITPLSLFTLINNGYNGKLAARGIEVTKQQTAWRFGSKV